VTHNADAGEQRLIFENAARSFITALNALTATLPLAPEIELTEIDAWIEQYAAIRTQTTKFVYDLKANRREQEYEQAHRHNNP
jgi:hypothetical protein